MLGFYPVDVGMVVQLRLDGIHANGGECLGTDKVYFGKEGI